MSSSLSSLSRRFLEVTYWPSLPAKGDVFTVKVIAIVGSSICILGSGFGSSASESVSPIVIPSSPAMAKTSPVLPMVSSIRFKPSNENNLVIFVFWKEPSSLQMLTSSPSFNVPLNTRPIASRPR